MISMPRLGADAWNASFYPMRLLLVAFIGVYLWLLGTVPAVIPLAVVVCGAVAYLLAYVAMWWQLGVRELPPPARLTATALDNALMLLVVPLDPIASLPLLVLVVINPFEFSVRYHARHLLSGYLGAAIAVAGILALRSQAPPGLDPAVAGVLLVLCFIVPYGLLTAFGQALVQDKLVDLSRALDLAHERSRSVSWTLDMVAGTGTFYGDVRSLIGLPPGPPLDAFEAIAGQVHADDEARVRQHLTDAAQPGGQVDLRFRVPHGQSGETLWMHAQGSIVVDAQGHAVELTGIMRDITDAVMAEQAHAKTREYLDAAIDASGIGVWSYDVQRDLVELDDSEIKLIEPQPGEFDGTAASFVGMVEPEEREEVAKVFAAIADDGQRRMVRLRRRLPDGSVRWMMGGGQAVAYADGKPARIVGATIDVTELVEARRAEEQFRERHDKALNSAQVSCWYWDAPTNTMEFDDWAHEQMGVKREELLPTVEGFADLVYEDDQPLVQKEIDESIAFRESFDVKFRVKNRLPKIHWRRTYGRVFRDEAGECIGFSGVVMDITPEMELRQALEHSNAELDDFAHIASHDLREPLRGLHNYAEFLREDYADKLDDEGRHMLTSLGRLAQRLEGLIGALQQYARLGRAEQAVAPTDLNTVLDGVLETMAFSLEDAGATVERTEPLPTWDCEGARIGEVLRNLINNAVKYNDAGAKHIQVGFDAAQQAVYVRDNGIGIAPEHHDRVFTLFKRLHTRDQYGGGTGSGLTLAQRIVERHGGRIWFESEPGQGTTFFFTIGQGNEQ